MGGGMNNGIGGALIKIADNLGDKLEAQRIQDNKKELIEDDRNYQAGIIEQENTRDDRLINDERNTRQGIIDQEVTQSNFDREDRQAHSLEIDAQGNLNSSGLPGSRSATGKTINDLMFYGLDQEAAIKFATGAKQNPQAHIGSLANSIMDQTGFRGTPEEAYNEAARIVNESIGGAPNPALNSAPSNEEDRIQAIMDANSGWDKDKAKRYLDYLDSK